MNTPNPWWASTAVGLAALAGVVSFGASAQAQQQAQCGSEGGRCSIGDAGLNRVYYGLDGRAVMFEVEGPAVGCENGVRGDPLVGADKRCTYEPVRNTRLLEADFEPCSEEGGVCRTGAADDAPVFVRYGTAGRWIYDVASGDYACTNGNAGFDIARGTKKVCELGPAYFDAMAPGSTVKWITGAAEGAKFRVATAPTLVRFGARGKGFVYRQLVGSPAQDIECKSKIFGRNPAPGEARFCQVAGVTPQIATRSGRWVRKKTFNGHSQVRIATEIGFKWSDSSSTTESRGMSLCQGLELGGGTTPVKSVTTLCATMKKSKTRTRVKGNAVKQKHTDICRPPPGAQLGAAYQYEQALDSACWERGQCAVTALTTDILCVYDPPGPIEDYLPRCRPGTCADANCTYCSKDSGWLNDEDRQAWAARSADDGRAATPDPDREGALEQDFDEQDLEDQDDEVLDDEFNDDD